MKQSSTGKRARFDWTVAYAYAVHGQTYEGHLESYAQAEGRYEDAKARAERIPVGATVPVYDRPGQPSEAVLVKGITSPALRLLMLLVPFNVSAYWLFAFMVKHRKTVKRRRHSVSSWKQRQAQEAADALDTTTRVCLVLGGAALVSIVVMQVMGGAEVSLPLAASAWACVIACGVLAAGWSRMRMNGPDDDLHLHSGAERSVLPQALNRKQRRALQRQKDGTREANPK